MPKSTMLYIAVILLAILFGAYLYKMYRVAPAIDFPKMELVDMEGNSVSLDQYAGKTIFLNFWASWCAPCRAEMPSMEQAKQLLADENIVFLTITDDPLPKLINFSKANNYSFIYWKIKGKLKDINILTIPTTYIIDPNGKVAMTKVNGMDWSNPETIEEIRVIAQQ